VDANDALIGTIVDLDFDVTATTAAVDGAVLAIESDGGFGVLVTTGGFGSLDLYYDVYFTLDNCTGDAYLGAIDGAEFQLSGNIFFVTNAGQDLHRVTHNSPTGGVLVESYWDVSHGTCVDGSFGIAGPEAPLVEAGWGSQFTPPFRISGLPSAAVGPGVVSVPAVGPLGLLTMAGLLLTLAVVFLRKVR